MASAKDHADNEQFWRIGIFFSPVSGGSQAGGMAGAQFFMRQLLRRRREGVLAVAGGLFSCILGANSLVVTRLH